MTEHPLNAADTEPSVRRLALSQWGWGTLALFAGGAIVGFLVSHFEQGGGSLSTGDFIALAIMLAIGVTAVIMLRRAIRRAEAEAASDYERRYNRMWLIVLALGAPVGIGLAMGTDLSDVGSVLSNDPIPPGWAIGIALVGSALFAASMVIYHRTVDDHEERAYLWGSSVAFHFLVAALPVAWLLARGGLIPTVDIGTAMLLVLASVFIQAAVWLWLKYR